MDPFGRAGSDKVHVSRSIVSMFDSTQMQRILKHSLGFEYDYEFGGPDGSEDSWVQHQINIGNLTSCGCCRGKHRPSSTSYAYKQPSRPTPATTCSPTPVKDQSGTSDTERKGRQIQQSKKDKERAEKKKKKKLKQKEKKRLEKLKKEKQDAGKNEEGDDSKQTKTEESVEATGEEGASCRVKELETAEDQESIRSEEESSDEDDDSCTSEELDLTSSFVSKAALIAKRQLEQNPKPVKAEKKVSEDKCKTALEKSDELQEEDNKELVVSCSPSFEDIMKISNDLAVIGNRYASAGEFDSAVRYFTDAIKYNPTEVRLFGNRSLCFEKMHEYEKALADADLSLGIRPGWTKGLYRKGRALAGLKRYDEAASALKEVLQLDTSCVEAAQELMRIQIIQLMEYGFSREQSSNALIIHRTVEKALEVLTKLNHTAGAVQNPPIVQVANVNGVSPILSASTKLSTAAANANAVAPSSPCAPTPNASRNLIPKKPTPPLKNSPREMFPVWVGNLDFPVTESMLANLFNKVGTVCSVKVLVHRRCAFVNFTKQEFCDKAIQRLNGHNLDGVRLVVRYPDRIPAGMGISSSAHKAGH